MVTNALLATAPATSADPALKPNQPNHSRPAPSRTAGRLCGRIGSRGQPRRLPSTSASASADAPELISTAVPPAKSSAPRALDIQPPRAPTSPFAAKIQCASGT